MKLSKIQANLALLLTATIWGAGYIFSKQATNAHMPAGVINAIRGLIYASLAFLFFHRQILRMNKSEFKIGLTAGIINLIAYQLQTAGIMYTTPGNNAFLTATYVVFVPFIMWLLTRETPSPKDYLAITLCIIGMCVLTNIFGGNFGFHTGDILVIVSAIFYAIQIVYFGREAATVNPWCIAFMLGAIQGAGGLLWSLLTESPHYAAINWSAAIGPVIILGVLSSFGAQTLQLIGQKFTDPTAAGLIMMTESVFGSLFSVLFGFEELTISLVAGGGLILLAILLMQIDFRKLFIKRERRA
ncbi:DMT family transporter [Lacticaseibacillus zhaodongensis]|uniref:DMT family transporter n=1 Tax=Lacticaseibacillus zhaodongensis TaxID=2668065 RepID=UPI0012D32005|nr:DMT family transporter [Lacticaseibacillus zhaodongensis]